MAAALLALLASALWGTADFLGGALSRRVPTVAVLTWSQLVSLGTIAAVLAAGGWHPPGGYLAWGAAGGLAGTVALGLLYRALATGRMSIVAPISGSGLVVPVVVGLASGERPGVAQLAGIVLAATGVVLASGPELRGGTGSARSVVYAATAAAGFGATLVCTDRGSATSTAMTVAVSFAVGLTIVVAWAAATRANLGVAGRDKAAIGAIGLLNLGAVGLYGVASRSGLVSVVAVLASLYPVATVLLARRCYAERLRGVQLAGVLAALAGVVLLGIR